MSRIPTGVRSPYTGHNVVIIAWFVYLSGDVFGPGYYVTDSYGSLSTDYNYHAWCMGPGSFLDVSGYNIYDSYGIWWKNVLSNFI